MKTTKLMLVLSLALIFATGYSNSGIPATTIKKFPVENKAKMVTYLVRVENTGYLQSTGQYMIVMTDGAGSQVAPAQAYHHGITDYKFTEGGTVRGTRVARMIKVPGRLNSLAIPPTVQSGVFYGGGTYLFIIRPTAAENDGAGKKE
jgi:hypothetical protein